MPCKKYVTALSTIGNTNSIDRAQPSSRLKPSLTNETSTLLPTSTSSRHAGTNQQPKLSITHRLWNSMLCYSSSSSTCRPSNLDFGRGASSQHSPCCVMLSERRRQLLLPSWHSPGRPSRVPTSDQTRRRTCYPRSDSSSSSGQVWNSPTLHIPCLRTSKPGYASRVRA